MQIHYNGRELVVEEALLIDLLLKHRISSATPGVAVAHNGEIVNRQHWSTLTIKDGDSIEVIRAVQGG